VRIFVKRASVGAHTDVTSQEQFNRVMPGGLPIQFHYNADRASLELRADDQNYPTSAHGFFELNINPQGDVTQARDVSRSRSIHTNSMAAKGAGGFTAKVEGASKTVGVVAGTLHRSFNEAKKAGLAEIQRNRSKETNVAS